MKKPPEVLLQQERHELKKKSGGGLLRLEAWGYHLGPEPTITRYNIAYINHAISSVDNGRVLGFDNAHGYHHRHYMGGVEVCEFISYHQTLARIEREWVEIVNLQRRQRR